jgi:hypothetical protein
MNSELELDTPKPRYKEEKTLFLKHPLLGSIPVFYARLYVDYPTFIFMKTTT